MMEMKQMRLTEYTDATSPFTFPSDGDRQELCLSEARHMGFLVHFMIVVNVIFRKDKLPSLVSEGHGGVKNRHKASIAGT